KVNSFAKAFIEFTSTGRGQVTVGGDLTVAASDEASITADSRLVPSANAVNNLAAIKDVIGQLELADYQYTTRSGEQTLLPSAPLTGTRVRIGPGYADGDEGAVYQYVGNGGTFDLGAIDYRNSPDWEKLAGADLADLLYPDIGNLTDSDARAVGVMIVLNDVRSDVDAYIDHATVEAGSVALSATEAAAIQAAATSNVSASGGSAFG